MVSFHLHLHIPIMTTSNQRSLNTKHLPIPVEVRGWVEIWKCQWMTHSLDVKRRHRIWQQHPQANCKLLDIRCKQSPTKKYLFSLNIYELQLRHTLCQLPFFSKPNTPGMMIRVCKLLCERIPLKCSFDAIAHRTDPLLLSHKTDLIAYPLKITPHTKHQMRIL